MFLRTRLLLYSFHGKNNLTWFMKQKEKTIGLEVTKVQLQINVCSINMSWSSQVTSFIKNKTLGKKVETLADLRRAQRGHMPPWKIEKNYPAIWGYDPMTSVLKRETNQPVSQMLLFWLTFAPRQNPISSSAPGWKDGDIYIPFICMYLYIFWQAKAEAILKKAKRPHRMYVFIYVCDIVSIHYCERWTESICTWG